ncbi:hypothetical protein GGS24DRAFT_477828 [Hypoxylon argillaceum]|nr:hypothetical protein GGS24DRAFT_477828 [Hypoxylon argillaceum]
MPEMTYYYTRREVLFRLAEPNLLAYIDLADARAIVPAFLRFSAVAIGYQYHQNIGGYGVIGILSNRAAETMILRSEVDASLTKKEMEPPCHRRGVQGYTKLIIYACGRDSHMASLLGAADLPRKAEGKESGTLVCVLI